MTAKEARVLDTSDDPDRISSLPDVVICHILAFLPTKYSVHTRLLSTRWTSLFSLVPILDFDYTLTPRSSFDTQNRFISFVNWVMLFNTSSHISKFRFNYRLLICK